MPNIRYWAKWDAKYIILSMRRGACITEVIEQLESCPENSARYRALAWRTIIGAARAAARELGRYDAVNDAILPPHTDAQTTTTQESTMSTAEACAIIEAHGLCARPCQLYILACGVGLDPVSVQALRGRILASLARKRIKALVVFRALASPSEE